MFLGEIYNACPSFAVQVDVDQPDRVYIKDEVLRATVTCSEEGYLYLFHRDAEGKVAMLYPNRFSKKNSIQKGETITVPAPGSIFQIRMDAPFGNELLKAVVSKEPLAFFDNLDLTGINMLPIGDEEGKELAKSVKGMKNSGWAVHQVSIRTVDPDAPQNGGVVDTGKKTRIFSLQRIINRLKNIRR